MSRKMDKTTWVYADHQLAQEWQADSHSVVQKGTKSQQAAEGN